MGLDSDCVTSVLSQTTSTTTQLKPTLGDSLTPVSTSLRVNTIGFSPEALLMSYTKERDEQRSFYTWSQHRRY